MYSRISVDASVGIFGLAILMSKSEAAMLLQLPSRSQRLRFTEDKARGFRVSFPLDPTLGEIVQYWKALLGWLALEISLGCVTFGALYQWLPSVHPLAAGMILAVILLIPCMIYPVWIMAIDGTQVVQIHGDQLLIYHEPGLFEKAKVYPLSEIRNLRYASYGGNILGFDVEPVSGRIAFDYHATTVRFGPGVTETESNIVILAIKERFRIADDPEIAYIDELF